MRENNLTHSERKTVSTIYKVIGRRISESRKSSRRKFEGISKKLNISVDILKKIESGNIEEIEKDIPITGFIRAYAKFTNTDISEEIDKLQTDYAISEKPKSIYYKQSNVKASKIFLVFLTSFCFLLLFIFILSKNNNSQDEKNKQENTKIFELDVLKTQTFETRFLSERWIEVYSVDKNLIKSALYSICDLTKRLFVEEKVSRAMQKKGYM